MPSRLTWKAADGRSSCSTNRCASAAPNRPPRTPTWCKLLADWGVTVNKDLVLDLSGIGGIFGLGPEVPVVAQYESHPITQPLTRLPTAFPLARSLEVKNGDKTTVEKLIATTEDSVAVTEIGAGRRHRSQEGQERPADAGRRGHVYGGSHRAASSWWALRCGRRTACWARARLANRDLLGNMINWLNSDEDLISIRPKTTEDRPLNITAQKLSMLFWLSVVIFPLAVVGLRPGHVVEAEVGHEAEGTADRRGAFGRSGRARSGGPTRSRPPRRADASVKILSIPDDQFQEIRIKKLTDEVHRSAPQRRQVGHDLSPSR